MTIIEEFLCYVYYPNVTAPVDIDALRMRDFEHSAHNNLRFLPPSKNGLLQHCRRAGYEAGWVQRQCLEDVDLPDPLMWGWSKINDEFVPKWQDVENPTATCSCTKAKCTNCLCSKQNLECLSFCKCQRHCLYTSI